MGKKGISEERRKHKRFEPYKAAYVFFDFYGEAIGQITDISEGGIGFLYAGYKDWSDGLSTVDVTIGNYVFSIKDIPVKDVWESNIPNDNSSISLSTKRCGIQFRSLTADQKSHLTNFIEIHTLKAEHLKK